MEGHSLFSLFSADLSTLSVQKNELHTDSASSYLSWLLDTYNLTLLANGISGERRNIVN